MQWHHSVSLAGLCIPWHALYGLKQSTREEELRNSTHYKSQGKGVSMPCSQVFWGRTWLSAACPAAWALLWAFLKWLQSRGHPLLTVMLSYSEICPLTLIFERFLQTTQNVSSSFSWFLMHLYRGGVENDCCIQEGFVWRMIWGWFVWKPLKRNLVLLENEKKETNQLAWVMLLFWCFLFKKSQHRQKPVRLDKTGSLHFLATRSSPSWC